MIKDQMQQAQQAAQQGDPRLGMVFQRIVAAAGKVVYDRATSRKLMQMVQSAPDPVAGVVQATLAVLDGLKTQVKGINPNFVYVASTVVALMILELAEAAKIIKFDRAILGQVTEGLKRGLEDRQLIAAAQPSAEGAPAGMPAQEGVQPTAGARQPMMGG